MSMRVLYEQSGVTVSGWPLDEPADVVAELGRLLSGDERTRAATFTRDEPRRRFVVARARLREHLGERLGVAAAAVSFRYGPNGKPSVEGVEFNLAHTGDLALCAVSERPVGIDVERVRPMKNATALAERWFHPAEVARIATAEDTLAEFFRTWTAKEAALKLVGVGVGESLPKVLTPPEPEGGRATGLPGNSLGLAQCDVRPLAAGDGYAAAIATP